MFMQICGKKALILNQEDFTVQILISILPEGRYGV